LTFHRPFWICGAPLVLVRRGSVRGRPVRLGGGSCQLVWILGSRRLVLGLSDLAVRMSLWRLADRWLSHPWPHGAGLAGWWPARSHMYSTCVIEAEHRRLPGITRSRAGPAGPAWPQTVDVRGCLDNEHPDQMLIRDDKLQATALGSSITAHRVAFHRFLVSWRDPCHAVAESGDAPRHPIIALTTGRQLAGVDGRGDQ
jgi:hypothetical protein